MDIKEINRLWDEYISVRRSLRRAIPEYLMEALMTFDHNCMELSDPARDEDEDRDCVYVTYDGGNHPEYATNPYSIVRYVYVKNGEVFLHLDEDDEYSLDRVYDIGELAELVDFVQARIDELNGKEGEVK